MTCAANREASAVAALVALCSRKEPVRREVMGGQQTQTGQPHRADRVLRGVAAFEDDVRLEWPVPDPGE